MKLFHLIAVAAVVAFSANVFAQPVTTTAPVAPQAAKTIKITKITGTVNIMKDGVVVMTLKPGDAIPEITGNSVTFAIVDGTVEVEADGKKVSAATGSNFTVTSANGQTNVAVGAGTPVAVKTESGNNVVMTANSEVKLAKTDGTVAITVVTGNAVVTDATGGNTQTVTVGQTVSVPAAPVMVAATPAAPVAKTETKTEDTFVAPPVIVAPVSSVIETQTVVEACTVSASSPDCH